LESTTEQFTVRSFRIHNMYIALNVEMPSRKKEGKKETRAEIKRMKEREKK
jgi:hypothetical protein